MENPHPVQRNWVSAIQEIVVKFSEILAKKANAWLIVTSHGIGNKLLLFKNCHIRNPRNQSKMWSGERKDKIQKNTDPPPRKSPSTTMRKLDLQIQCRGLLIVCSLLYLSSRIGETTWQHGKWEVNPLSSYPSPSLSFDLTVHPSFFSLLCCWASQVSKQLPGHSINKNRFCL